MQSWPVMPQVDKLMGITLRFQKVHLYTHFSLNGTTIGTRFSNYEIFQLLLKLLLLFSHCRVQHFVTPRIVASQAPLSMGFPRQEYWSGLPFPSPGDLGPGIKLGSPALASDSLPSEPPGSLSSKIQATILQTTCHCQA